MHVMHTWQPYCSLAHWLLCNDSIRLPCGSSTKRGQYMRGKLGQCALPCIVRVSILHHVFCPLAVHVLLHQDDTGSHPSGSCRQMEMQQARVGTGLGVQQLLLSRYQQLLLPATNAPWPCVACTPASAAAAPPQH